MTACPSRPSNLTASHSSSSAPRAPRNDSGRSIQAPPSRKRAGSISATQCPAVSASRLDAIMDEVHAIEQREVHR
jgi:hypothetical protein